MQGASSNQRETHDYGSAEFLNRRSLLMRAGVGAGLMAAGPLLAACGSSGSDPTSSGEVGGELNIYTWEGYDAPDASAAWQKKNGVNVKAGYVGVQGDVETKIKSPAGRGIDESTVNQSYVNYYDELGILTPISEEEVPALKDLWPEFQGAPYRNEDGTYKAVPYCFGYNGLAYNPERVAKPDTWEALFDPALKGRVAVWDDPYFSLQLAALVQGFNPDKLTHEELDQVKEWLARLAPQVKVFAPSVGDFITVLSSGDVDAVYNAWSATPIFIGDAPAAVALPEEGALGWLDCDFIPPDADNRATALAWIQTTLSGKVAAEAYDSFGGGSVTKSVVPLLDKPTRDLFPYDDLQSLFSQLALPLGFPRGDTEYVTADEAIAAWEEFKASAS